MRVGSVVRQRFFLREPPMTVERLFANEVNRPPSLHADCVWFDAENKLRRAAFGTRELEEVMHYKDGTEAKVFDKVRGSFYAQDPDGTYSQKEREGVLLSANPGCTACNGQVLLGDLKIRGTVSFQEKDGSWSSAQIINGALTTVTIGELELVERIKNPPKIGVGG
jgi:hypothetical protein